MPTRTEYRLEDLRREAAKQSYMGKTWQEVYAKRSQYREMSYANWRKPQPDDVLYSYMTGAMFVRAASDFFRVVGDAHDICKREGSRRVEHSGWYCNSLQDDLAIGFVAQMTAVDGKPRFIAGVRTTDSCGEIVWPLEVFDDLLEAVSSADHQAERFAEDAREYEAKDRAEQEIEELREEIRANRTERHELVREMRRLKGAVESSIICKALRGRIIQLKEESRKAHKRIAKLDDNFWEAVPC
jgi:hypothetical protein